MECYGEKKNKEVLGNFPGTVLGVSDTKINKHSHCSEQAYRLGRGDTDKYIYTKITVQCDKHSNQSVQILVLDSKVECAL